MNNKEKIPCRVCGKLFTPCSTCQKKDKTFMWRNFACSEKCAREYIAKTIAYRETLRNNQKQQEN